MGKPESKTKGKSRRTSQPPHSSVPPAAKKGSSAAAGKRPSARGAAPWAARHAAKHAAEARARNAEPPRPGSARATLRTPDEAERIKARVGELHTALGKIRALRKNLAANFYQIGQILREIHSEKLYDAKGYASFEAFAEREVDLGKALTLKLARIPVLFQAPAIELGLEPLLAALTAIEDTLSGNPPQPAAGPNRPPLPMKPPRSGGRS